MPPRATADVGKPGWDGIDRHDLAYTTTTSASLSQGEARDAPLDQLRGRSASREAAASDQRLTPWSLNIQQLLLVGPLGREEGATDVRGPGA